MHHRLLMAGTIFHSSENIKSFKSEVGKLFCDTNYSCLGRNVIKLQSSHIRSTPGYCPWPTTVSDINDPPNCMNSSTSRMFADDYLIYKEIHSQQETEDLQADIDALQTWERRWLMSFHPEKCQLLRITRKPSPIINFE